MQRFRVNKISTRLREKSTFTIYFDFSSRPQMKKWLGKKKSYYSQECQYRKKIWNFEQFGFGYTLIQAVEVKLRGYFVTKCSSHYIILQLGLFRLVFKRPSLLIVKRKRGGFVSVLPIIGLIVLNPIIPSINSIFWISAFSNLRFNSICKVRLKHPTFLQIILLESILKKVWPQQLLGRNIAKDLPYLKPRKFQKFNGRTFYILTDKCTRF